MKTVNIATIDLNLLRVFDAIVTEGSIVRAAGRLGMSQPAVSHALARLRHALDDALFIRTAAGMQPTAEASRLAEHVRLALMHFELGLKSTAFDPASATRSFSVAVDNYCAMVLAGPALAAICRAAPQVKIRFRPSGTLDAEGMLDRGELDLTLGAALPSRDRFAAEELFSDDFVVLRKALPGGQARPLSMEEFASFRHLHLSSTHDDTTFIDHEFEIRGLTRQMDHSVPLLACEAALAEIDAVVVMHRAMAATFAARGVIAIEPLPFPSPRQSICMCWHRRFSGDPAHEWLRRTIKIAASSMTSSKRGSNTARQQSPAHIGRSPRLFA